jgi:hypothetical protein
MSVLLDGWYRDLADVYRVSPVTSGGVTRDERTRVIAGMPCRIYNSAKPGPAFTQTAANLTANDKLAADTNWDVRPGDELIITRGGSASRPELRYFAGMPQYYYDDLAGIDHQEIPIYHNERIR